MKALEANRQGRTTGRRWETESYKGGDSFDALRELKGAEQEGWSRSPVSICESMREDLVARVCLFWEEAVKSAIKVDDSKSLSA